MALIDCNECGKKVSEKASSCPGCGNPIITNKIESPPPLPKKTSAKTKGCLGCLGVSILLMLVFALFDDEKNQQNSNLPSDSKRIVSSNIGTPTLTSEPQVSQKKKEVLGFEVLKDDIYDAPVKTQVSQDILVSGEISEEGLRTLLFEIYNSIESRTGFKYHEYPTNIYIYAYSSKEKADSGMRQLQC